MQRPARSIKPRCKRLARCAILDKRRSDAECRTARSRSFSQNVSGSTYCYTCPKGTFSNQNGQGACQPCQAGRFGTANGASTCQDCTPGKATMSTGALGCTDCPGSLKQLLRRLKCSLQRALRNQARADRLALDAVRVQPCCELSRVFLISFIAAPGRYTAISLQTACLPCPTVPRLLDAIR